MNDYVYGALEALAWVLGLIERLLSRLLRDRLCLFSS